MKQIDLIHKLQKERILTKGEFIYLFDHIDKESHACISSLARSATKQIYETDIYPRGLIEFTNYCKNNCLYCGIRGANEKIRRYRLNQNTILNTCHHGYALGYRSFVLQGGEDMSYDDAQMVSIVSSIREEFPDCAITLSLGERDYESYQKLYRAGANRYLLRHETATKDHYELLHPSNMSFEHRIQCLWNLKDIGYDVGTGFMVGAPYQTNEHLAADFLLIKELDPQMVGIGPFVPHHDTPFCDFPAGTVEKTTFLLAALRLMNPHLLLPSTTSLGTISPNGREAGILSGANVVMPNLSPMEHRKDYALYDNKICTGEESAEAKGDLAKRIESIGYRLNFCRGDYIPR